MDSSNGDPKYTCQVVAIPYPGRSHINQMINLCKLVSKLRPNFLITFIITQEWHGFLSSEPHPGNNIRFATIPNVIPSEIGRSKDIVGFVKAVLTKMEGPVESLIQQLQPPKPNFIIYDAFLKWVIDLANRNSIPAAALWPLSTTLYTILRHYDNLVQNGHLPANPLEQGDHRLTCIPGVPSIRIADFPRELFEDKTHSFIDEALEIVSLTSKAEYLLFGSIYELESQAIDNFKKELPNPIYTIGLAIPSFDIDTKINNNYMAWLDAQPRASVLYISQGSFLSASNEQLDEIVAGVRNSGVRFFWVGRENSSKFHEESGSDSGSGLVVPWCDQLKVLCHPSIGGFWSHCGWNSTKEAAFAGVPLLTFPLIWDQYTNSKLIVEDWEIGWRVKRDDGSLIKREDISRMLKRFMNLECDEGKEMRRRAQELGEICQRASAEGGSSQLQVEAFINDISTLHS
ncbi:hypothetical protein ACH5RR_010257 [Cinchona calisaya]|uniref:Uncharacterized protein n=1 Tax=Cinchona calisaya TaxID=153742 RepID=A0ABD3AIA7_9GENT